MRNTENHILNQQGQPALVASFFVIESVIRFIDMFSGIGGFREGLTRAGGFACVGHCEIDKYANRSYNALFDTKGEWFVEWCKAGRYRNRCSKRRGRRCSD